MFPTSIKPIDKQGFDNLDPLFAKAFVKITKELEGATSFGTYNRKALLAQLKKILENAGVDVAKFIEKEIPEQYRAGLTGADEQLKKVGGDINASYQFNRIHKEVVAALLDETGKSFAEAMSGVNRFMIQTISESVKNNVTEILATGKVSGQNLRTTKLQILDAFHNDGLVALVDKAGKRWGLGTYTTMLIQTKSTEARNRGLVNRMAENGWDLVQVSSHGATDVCGEWEGKILSISGNTPGYPTVDQATTAGLFHPNCRHAINVINPKIAEITNAYDPNEDPVTPEEGQDLLKEKTYTVFRGEGGDNPAHGLAAYGRGKYYSFDKGYAAAFGDVSESQVILKNPLVLKTVDDLQSATDKAIAAGYETIAQWAKSKGYDGLIDEVSEVLLKF